MVSYHIVSYRTEQTKRRPSSDRLMCAASSHTSLLAAGFSPHSTWQLALARIVERLIDGRQVTKLVAPTQLASALLGVR